MQQLSPFYGVTQFLHVHVYFCLHIPSTLHNELNSTGDLLPCSQAGSRGHPPWIHGQRCDPCPRL